MPVDGTFGRLRAHKNRMKQLASKKRERTDMNKFVGSYSSDRTIDVQTADPELLKDIRSQRKAENRRKGIINLIIYTLALAMSVWIGFLLYDYIF